LVLGRGTSRSSEAAVVAARRHALAVSVLAPIAGLVAAVLLVLAGGDGHHGFPGSTGDALSLAPGAWALTHTLVHLAGELTWPRPEGRVRRARLVRRRMRDVAPRMLVRLGAGGLALLAVELLLGIALAGPDGARVSHGTPG